MTTEHAIFRQPDDPPVTRLASVHFPEPIRVQQGEVLSIETAIHFDANGNVTGAELISARAEPEPFIVGG